MHTLCVCKGRRTVGGEGHLPLVKRRVERVHQHAEAGPGQQRLGEVYQRISFRLMARSMRTS